MTNSINTIIVNFHISNTYLHIKMLYKMQIKTVVYSLKAFNNIQVDNICKTD